MWHNEGLYLWAIQSPLAGISPVRAFTFLSAHLLEKRNYIQIRRIGVKELSLMYSYFSSTSSFQRRGRGNWCVKINYGHKKIICRIACWFSLINLTFLSMSHEEAGVSQLDKRCQPPGMEAVEWVGLSWASMVCDSSADWPHHLPMPQSPQCTGGQWHCHRVWGTQCCAMLLQCSHQDPSHPLHKNWNCSFGSSLDGKGALPFFSSAHFRRLSSLYEKWEFAYVF